MKKTGEEIISEFTEEEFIASLERYFSNTILYPKNKENIKITRISQNLERRLGYDGIITTIIPFYVQFKRSKFLTPISQSKIMNDRKKFLYSIKKGAYCFPLHKNGQEFDQHNAMYRLAIDSPFKRKVIYAAPLFFRKNQLDNLREGDRFAYRYRDVYIQDPEIHTISRFNRVPFFNNVMTIPPHKLVDKTIESHHYSFSDKIEVSFHSDPERVPEEFPTQLLSDFLVTLNDEEGIRDIDEYAEKTFLLIRKLLGFRSNTPQFKSIVITSITRALGINFDSSISVDKMFQQIESLDKLVVIEDILKEHLNIYQFFKYSVLEIL